MDGNGRLVRQQAVNNRHLTAPSYCLIPSIDSFKSHAIIAVVTIIV